MNEKKLLHITNGDGLTEKLQQLGISGKTIIWREMLCEGPTIQDVGSDEFVRIREKFLQENYDVSPQEYQENFLGELEKLAHINGYDEIILWFEFDLFSHMNMVALISFLIQHKEQKPIYLVCSGRLKGEQELLPLPELSIKQLQQHYKCKINLTQSDVETANLIWELYCGSNPIWLISEITKTTNFEYLSSSIRAHIARFPNAKTGLNTLEDNLLKLIDQHHVTSLHHLLGYALQYQGYYGYGDIQMQRVIEKLRCFYTETDVGVEINEAGKKAINGTKNYYQDLKDNEFYGGAEKYNFLYDPDSHTLLKL